MGDNLIMHDMLILWRESIPKKMIDILQPYAFNPANPQPTLFPFAALRILPFTFNAFVTYITLVTFLALLPGSPLLPCSDSTPLLPSSPLDPGHLPEQL
jgi:hypothetical protein